MEPKKFYFDTFARMCKGIKIKKRQVFLALFILF